MGSVEVGCEGSWLPHPEEQLFLDQLYTFMDRRGSPIHKVPNLGFKKSESDISCPVCVVNMCSGQTEELDWSSAENKTKHRRSDGVLLVRLMV